jgi:hypothetical protein
MISLIQKRRFCGLDLPEKFVGRLGNLCFVQLRVKEFKFRFGMKLQQNKYKMFKIKIQEN